MILKINIFLVCFKIYPSNIRFSNNQQLFMITDKWHEEKKNEYKICNDYDQMRVNYLFG